MIAFLYVLGSLVLLVMFGLAVSLYLYQRGAIGRKRYARLGGLRVLAFENTAEDDSQFY